MDNIDVSNVSNDELLNLKKTIEEYLAFLDAKIKDNISVGDEDE